MLVKDEAPWIAAHVLSLLPHVDSMVFFDGNSTDGTRDIIRQIAFEHQDGWKILLVPNRDPKDLQDDYVRLFNDALRSLDTDLAWFVHPDMVCTNPEQIRKVADSSAVALSVKMRSFAGEPDGKLYEMGGRGQLWKSIYRLKNPDLGAHYFGHYGAANEDVYFRAVTGNRHDHYGSDMSAYPYEVEESGLEVLHFSDVRTHARRLDRMKKCLANQGRSKEQIEELAANHPRVSLKPDFGFTLTPAEYPEFMTEARAKYRHLEKEPSIA